MKFLVIEKCIESSPVAETYRKAMPSQYEFYEGLIKQGKVDVQYSLAGERGSVAIFNVESAAELSALVLGSPMSWFTTKEVYPLVPHQEMREVMKKMVGRLPVAHRTSAGRAKRE